MTQEVKSALVHFMGGNAPECKWAQGLLWNLNNWFNLFVSFTAFPASGLQLYWFEPVMLFRPFHTFHLICPVTSSCVRKPRQDYWI